MEQHPLPPTAAPRKRPCPGGEVFFSVLRLQPAPVAYRLAGKPRLFFSQGLNSFVLLPYKSAAVRAASCGKPEIAVPG